MPVRRVTGAPKTATTAPRSSARVNSSRRRFRMSAIPATPSIELPFATGTLAWVSSAISPLTAARIDSMTRPASTTIAS